MKNKAKNKANKRAKIKSYIKKIRICKTITWRLLSLATSTIIAFIITGDLFIGLSIGFSDSILKLVMYWWHEKKWDQIIKKKIKSIKTQRNEK